MSGAQQQSRSAASQSPYAQLFRIPGAKAFCISGAVARLPISMMSLGIVLALNHMYDNWTVAGSMSAMYILAVAAVTPFYARLFDPLPAMAPLLLSSFQLLSQLPHRTIPA